MDDSSSSLSAAQLQIIVRALVFAFVVGIWGGKRSRSFGAGILWFLVSVIAGGFVALCFVLYLPDAAQRFRRQSRREELGRLLKSAPRRGVPPPLSATASLGSSIGNLPTAS